MKEIRARQHALQDEVMHKFFTQIGSLMETQYSTIFRCTQQYQSILKTTNNNSTSITKSKDEKEKYESDLKELRKLEEQIDDVMLSIDDWLYYIKDVFSLNISILRRCLVHHLLTEFIYPFLLEPLKSFYSKENENEKENIIGNKSEKNNENNSDNVNRNSVAKSEKSVAENILRVEDASVGLVVSLVYLIKVITEYFLLKTGVAVIMIMLYFIEEYGVWLVHVVIVLLYEVLHCIGLHCIVPYRIVL